MEHLIPFYKYIYTILPCTELQSKHSNLTYSSNIKGYYEFFFLLKSYYNSFQMKSREEIDEIADHRVVINIFSINHNKNEYTFPPFLKISVNNCQIHLSDYLPFDNERTWGRRYARPIDITDAIVFDKDYKNHCVIKWGQEYCNTKFMFALFILKRKSTDELCSQIMKKPVYEIGKNQSLISSYLSITSLHCPASLCRMGFPVRGDTCTHLQCFDLVTYLTMNFLKPIWRCPICDKETPYHLLRVDSLIHNILNDERSKPLKEIKFNDKGQWKPYTDLDSIRIRKSPYFDMTTVNKRRFSENNNTSKPATKKRCLLSLKNLFDQSSSNQSNVLSSVNLTNSSYEYNHSSSSIIYDFNDLDPVTDITKNAPQSFPHSMSFSEDTIDLSELSPILVASEELIECDKGNFSDENSCQSDEPIECFKTLPNSDLKYRLVNREPAYYVEFEKYISLENKDIITFAKPEDIPNSLKGEATEKRKLVLLRMDQGSVIRMSQFNSKSGDIEINVGRKPLELYIQLENGNDRYLINLEPLTSINIISQTGNTDQIQLLFNAPEKSMAAVEMYEEENNISKSPLDILDDDFQITEDIYIENKSFLRRPLELENMRKKIRFLDVKYGIGKYCLRFLPLAVVVLDYDGNVLFEEIVTPRGFVANYRQEINGLLETDVRGCLDEEECTNQLRNILRDSIIVGFKVAPNLFSLRIELERIFGIRDLSTGLCFDKTPNSSEKCLYTLKYLSSSILNRDIQIVPGQYLHKENVIAIRDIYLLMESKWVDQIHQGRSDVSIGRNFEFFNSYTSTVDSSQLLRNTIKQFKAMEEAFSLSEYDLEEVPDIEIMEVDDVNLLQELSTKPSHNSESMTQPISDDGNNENDDSAQRSLINCEIQHLIELVNDKSNLTSPASDRMTKITSDIDTHEVFASETYGNEQNPIQIDRETSEIIDRENLDISNSSSLNEYEATSPPEIEREISTINQSFKELSDLSPTGAQYGTSEKETIPTDVECCLITSDNSVISIDSDDESLGQDPTIYTDDEAVVEIKIDIAKSQNRNNRSINLVDYRSNCGSVSTDYANCSSALHESADIDNDDDIEVVEIEHLNKSKFRSESLSMVKDSVAGQSIENNVEYIDCLSTIIDNGKDIESPHIDNSTILIEPVDSLTIDNSAAVLIDTESSHVDNSAILVKDIDSPNIDDSITTSNFIEPDNDIDTNAILLDAFDTSKAASATILNDMEPPSIDASSILMEAIDSSNGNSATVLNEIYNSVIVMNYLDSSNIDNNTAVLNDMDSSGIDNIAAVLNDMDSSDIDHSAAVLNDMDSSSIDNIAAVLNDMDSFDIDHSAIKLKDMDSFDIDNSAIKLKDMDSFDIDNSAIKLNDMDSSSIDNIAAVLNDMDSSDIDHSAIKLKDMDSSDIDHSAIKLKDMDSSGIDNIAAVLNDMDSSDIDHSAIKLKDMDSSGIDNIAAVLKDMDSSDIDNIAAVLNDMDSSDIDNSAIKLKDMDSSDIDNIAAVLNDMDSSDIDNSAIKLKDMDSSGIDNIAAVLNDMDSSDIDHSAIKLKDIDSSDIDNSEIKLKDMDSQIRSDSNEGNNNNIIEANSTSLSQNELNQTKSTSSNLIENFPGQEYLSVDKRKIIDFNYNKIDQKYSPIQSIESAPGEIETIVMDNKQFPSLKIKDKNGKFNYLISGVFYCPENGARTRLQLDDNGMCELNQSAKVSADLDENSD